MSRQIDVAKVREQLRTIAEDMADDARTFDGQPMDGLRIGTAFGNHGAAIARLAEIVSELMPVFDEHPVLCRATEGGFFRHDVGVPHVHQCVYPARVPSDIDGRIVHRCECGAEWWTEPGPDDTDSEVAL